MYNAMLEKVTRVIEATVGRTKVEGESSEMYNYLFNPTAYLETQEKKRQKDNLKQNLIAGVTVVAALGEGYHLIKRSGIIDKLTKK